jgi:two-component system sensor histidine kinase BarA
MVESSIDRPTFENMRDAVGGDLEFMAELVAAFDADAPVQVASMKAALDLGDVAAIVRPAHTLKSSSASLGALELADRCGALEATARSGSMEGVAVAVADIERAVTAAQRDLADLLAA